MNSENYWRQFMATGRVEDYLTYAEKMQQEKRDSPEGERPYAGFLYGDGDGDKPDPCR